MYLHTQLGAVAFGFRLQINNNQPHGENVNEEPSNSSIPAVLLAAPLALYAQSNGTANATAQSTTQPTTEPVTIAKADPAPGTAV